MTHALKTWIQFYKDVENGSKTFELRRDDRPFKIGDTLLLQEYNGQHNLYTGKESVFIITYILRGATTFGLTDGFCILGMKEKREPEY
jgi:hypothetical protein